MMTHTVRYCQNEDCDYKMAVDNAKPSQGPGTEVAAAAELSEK
jgi:hypothetical protein